MLPIKTLNGHLQTLGIRRYNRGELSDVAEEDDEEEAAAINSIDNGFIVQVVLATLGRKTTPLMIGSLVHALMKGVKAEYAVVKFGEEKTPMIKSWLDAKVTVSIRAILMMLSILVLTTMATLYIYSKPCATA